MKTTIFSMLVLCSMFAQSALDPKCIRTRVLEGETCDQLKIDFDFGLCGVAGLAGKTVKSNCVNQKAVAYVKDENEVYIATYGAPQKEGGKWKYLSIRKEVRGSQKTEKTQKAIALPQVQTSASGVVSEDLMKKAEDLAAKTDDNLKSAEKHSQITAAIENAQNTPAQPVPPPTEVTPPQDGAPAKSTETMEAAPVTALPPNLLALSKIKLNGHLDTFYSYNMNSPAPNAVPASGSLQLNPNHTNKYRSFDGYHDQFTLAMALFRIQREEDGNGFIVDLGFGQNTASMLSYSESTQYIPQAYLKLKMGESWNFYVGKMLTHMGLESAYSVENWSYSRSLLFTYGLPTSHTGMAFEWKASPKFSSTFYVYNNWAGMFEYNRTRNFGLRFDYSPSETLNFKYNVIGGNEKTTIPDSARVVHDLNMTWMMASRYGLQLEYAMGAENKALAGADVAWNSAILGFLWKLDKDLVDLRAEMYADTNGYTIDGGYGSTVANIQSLTAITLGYTWKLAAGAKTRLECRQDQSDKNVFTDVNGASTNAQMTGALAFTYEY